MKRNWKEERQEAIRVVKRVVSARGRDPVNLLGREAYGVVSGLVARFPNHPCRRWLLEAPAGQLAIFIREWEAWRSTEVLRQATRREPDFDKRILEHLSSASFAPPSGYIVDRELGEDEVLLVAEYERGSTG